MITLKKLRYFEALARTGHFGRAADLCSVSQPALSMQIQELEADLGIKLLVRNHNGISLTPEGEEILHRAGKVILDVESINAYAASLSRLEGTLKLGIIPTVGPYLLPRLLPCLAKEKPELKLSIRETQTERLLDELRTGKIEVAVAALPIVDETLEHVELFQDRFLLATPKGQVAPTRSAALRDFIASEQLLLLEEGHCLRDQALNHCDVAGIQYGEIYGTSNLSTLVQLVASGHGITLVPEICLEAEVSAERVRLTRFPKPEPYRRLALFWRSTSPRSHHYLELGETIKRLHS